MLSPDEFLAARRAYIRTLDPGAVLTAKQMEFACSLQCPKCEEVSLFKASSYWCPKHGRWWLTNNSTGAREASAHIFPGNMGLYTPQFLQDGDVFTSLVTHRYVVDEHYPYTPGPRAIVKTHRRKS